MPVYVYHCDKCEKEFEKTQRFSDKPLEKCPYCGEKDLHKVFTPVSIIYKGSGFYSTDHRSSSGASSKARSNSNHEESTKESKEPTKTDTKKTKEKSETKA